MSDPTQDHARRAIEATQRLARHAEPALRKAVARTRPEDFTVEERLALAHTLGMSLVWTEKGGKMSTAAKVELKYLADDKLMVAWQAPNEGPRGFQVIDLSDLKMHAAIEDQKAAAARGESTH